KKIWSVDTYQKFGVRKGFFGAASSPVVEGDRVLLNAGGTMGAGIVAFDKDSGKVLWTATDDEASYSSPVVATIAGARHALFFTRAGLVDLDPAARPGGPRSRRRPGSPPVFVALEEPRLGECRHAPGCRQPDLSIRQLRNGGDVASSGRQQGEATLVLRRSTLEPLLHQRLSQR